MITKSCAHVSVLAGLVAAIAVAGPAGAQTVDRPLRAVSDPGVITTRQAITPAGVQTVFDGRVNGAAFGWGDLSVVPYVNGSVGQGNPPLRGSKLSDWLERANARPSVAATNADMAAMASASTTMPNVAELVEKGLFKREYRDHRLEWMIKSGGAQVVMDGLARDTIRFSPTFG